MVLSGCFLGLVLQLLLGKLSTTSTDALVLFNCWNKLKQMVGLLMCRPVMLLDGWI